jgi:hypothetical protein
MKIGRAGVALRAIAPLGRECALHHIPPAGGTITFLLALGGDKKVIARRGALRSAWSLAGIGLAIAVNGAWIAALAYGISKLF